MFQSISGISSLTVTLSSTMLVGVVAVFRLERLQRLSEKVHRECKGHETQLDDVERRIMEVEQHNTGYQL